ncbi:hypothetical protein IHI24_000937 [Rickettsia endosymbiont of Cardiosporidium cionae]|nr:hypothetical protein IHI24_000937 [Rickettsia endosymbiont of Cardiosporidium cionae]
MLSSNKLTTGLLIDLDNNNPTIIIAILNVRNCIISVYTTAFIPPIPEYKVTKIEAKINAKLGLRLVKYPIILLNAVNCMAIKPMALIMMVIDIIYLIFFP